MSDKYFEILQINPTNDKNIIKKAFRKLIFKYHPDMGGDFSVNKVSLLIEAYRKLIEYTEKNEKVGHEIFASTYEKIFDKKYSSPHSEKDLLKYIDDFMINIKDIYHDSSNISFYQNFINKLIDSSNEISETDILLSKGILQGVLLVIQSRFSVNNRIDQINDELKLVMFRKSFMDYLQNITDSSNYISFRMSIHSPKESLLKDAARLYIEINEPELKEELVGIIIIIICISDSSFFDKWYNLVIKNKDEKS